MRGIRNWKSFLAYRAQPDDKDLGPDFCRIGETFTLPSKAVPGMSLSIRELLDRYVHGHQVPQFEGVYDDEGNFPPGVEHLTEIERIDLAREMSTVQEDIRKKLQTKSDARKKAAEEAASAKLLSEQHNSPPEKSVDFLSTDGSGGSTT